AAVARAVQLAQHLRQMPLVAVPDAVGDDLVKTGTEGGCTPRQGDEKLRIQERFAAGEAEPLDAVRMRVFEELNGGVDAEPVGPLDGHAAVRTSEVALIGAGERQVVGPKGPRAPPHRPPESATRRS